MRGNATKVLERRGESYRYNWHFFSGLEDGGDCRELVVPVIAGCLGSLAARNWADLKVADTKPRPDGFTFQ